MSVKQIVMAAAGLGGAAEATYIEDVFSTYLYTGNGSTQTITNGIDLAGEGGLVWLKARSAPYANELYDTVRGAGNLLESQSTNAAYQFSPVNSGGVSAFGATGFTLGSRQDANNNGTTFASWTFRKAEKFFDVVTYTGNMTARTISHNLGSVPGCIIVKSTNGSGSWYVYHRSVGNTGALRLNLTNTVDTSPYWNNTTPTSTSFTVGVDSGVNALSTDYVAYLFAHDAGGFGDDGSENVISCGSYTTNSSGVASPIELGWEPQFVMLKRATGTEDWEIYDSMRGMPVTDNASKKLAPNSSAAETTVFGRIAPTATGFIETGSTISSTYIYIAIRRGPMKTPESGTSVFAPVVYAGNGTTQDITTGFANDMEIIRRRGSAENNVIEDKLRGKEVLFTNTTDAGLASTGDVTGYLNTGFTLGASNQGSTNDGGSPSYISWNFRRAPGFFDEVCYTGNGVDNTQINHNLTVAPEFVIVKRRNDVTPWSCYYPATNIGLQLNGTNAGATPDFSGVSATTFTVRNFNATNANGSTYVAYLFASCPGVSKVGSYTGTAATQQINCGFTGGARFVLIKRTDSTGAWYVWDSARGIVAGNDPYLLLNSTAVEVTSTDYVDTYSAGFEISSTAPAAINANGGTFIFLAIA